MKKLITGIVTAVTLTMSLSAGVVDSRISPDSFKYAFMFQNNKCVKMNQDFSKFMYQNYEKNTDSLIKNDDMNILSYDGTSILFYEKEAECKSLQNGGKDKIIKAKFLTGYGATIVNLCKIKPTVSQIFDIIDIAVAYELNHQGTREDSIKYAVNLLCKF